MVVVFGQSVEDSLLYEHEPSTQHEEHVMSKVSRKSSVNQFAVVGSDATVRVSANAWEGFHKVEWVLSDFSTLPGELYISVGQARALVDALTAVLDES